MTDLGNYIRQRRKELHLTQKELGKLISRSESSVNGYERGTTNVPDDMLRPLAAALEVSPMRLYNLAGVFDDFPAAKLMLMADRLDLTDEQISHAIETIRVMFKKDS